VLFSIGRVFAELTHRSAQIRKIVRDFLASPSGFVNLVNVWRVAGIVERAA
jgi:hypothetical protein